MSLKENSSVHFNTPVTSQVVTKQDEKPTARQRSNRKGQNGLESSSCDRDMPEEFTSNLNEMDMKLSRSAMPRHLEPEVRRQTLHTASSSAKSIYARRAYLASHSEKKSTVGTDGEVNHVGRKDDIVRSRRLSYGGNSHISRSRISSNKNLTALKKELDHQKKLESTRQHRLNGMDIKLKATNSKLTVLQEKYNKDTHQYREQISELKKKMKGMAKMNRRFEIIRLKQEETIRRLRDELKKHTGSSTLPNEKDEKFGNASQVLSKAKQEMPVLKNSARRYTMAPGEVSRVKGKRDAKEQKIPSSTESVNVRVENLPAGTKSQTLLDMCRNFGDITHIRVMKDGKSGHLKGLVTFVDSTCAQDAVEGLRGQGFKAEKVSAQK